jgi:carboxypeptidase Taq
MTAERRLAELKRRLIEVSDLQTTAAVLSWDQTTYMPPGGGPLRGRQLALLSGLAHARAVDPEIGHLLEGLQAHADSLDPDSDDAALIHRTTRWYERLVRVPVRFVEQMAEHEAASYEAWVRARPADDFAAVQPFLERTLELSRELAGFHPGYAHIADPLIDEADEGMTAASVSALFEELRAGLVPIVRAIAAQPLADDSCLRGHFGKPAQLAFASGAAREFGFDFERGRQDETAHPYMTRFGWGDVRITTNIGEDHLARGLLATLHETGHALYEQGVSRELDGLPTGHGVSAGVHESQSRLWEHFVGTSRGYWEYEYPKLQQAFPEQLGGVALDAFYRAVNRVKPSLIRIHADEVTYNLHIIIRFGLELELLAGALEVRDLPEAWRERYAADLAAPTDDRDGVLQDVHWYAGPIGGAFQGYTLGNLMAAQFFDAAVQAHPDIPAAVAAGDFAPLHGWLVEHVYVHGAKYPPNELIGRATGGQVQVAPYLDHLRRKFGSLYDLAQIG